jgi:hypothetical protein
VTQVDSVPMGMRGPKVEKLKAVAEDLAMQQRAMHLRVGQRSRTESVAMEWLTLMHNPACWFCGKHGCHGNGASCPRGRSGYCCCMCDRSKNGHTNPQDFNRYPSKQNKYSGCCPMPLDRDSNVMRCGACYLPLTTSMHKVSISSAAGSDEPARQQVTFNACRDAMLHAASTPVVKGTARYLQRKDKARGFLLWLHRELSLEEAATSSSLGLLDLPLFLRSVSTGKLPLEELLVITHGLWGGPASTSVQDRQGIDQMQLYQDTILSVISWAHGRRPGI